jgi:hypothetical protein
MLFVLRSVLLSISIMSLFGMALSSDSAVGCLFVSLFAGGGAWLLGK